MEVDNAAPALLVMDYQVGIAERYAGDPALISRLAGAIAAARTAEIPIVFVRLAFRDGYPEVSLQNRIFGPLSKGTGLLETDAESSIVGALQPQSRDIVVTKRRVSAFSGSDLSVVLRSLRVDALILAGIATSGVVLSTLREAADRDFRLLVLSDACADSDSEVHAVLMQKIFPRQAQVLTVQEWIASLGN